MTIQTEFVEAELREEFGTGQARELKRNGKIPAVIYGNKKENVSIILRAYDIEERARKVNFNTKPYTIKIGDKNYTAIPQQVQKHPVTDNVLHIDFKHIDENSEIKVGVLIHVINKDKSIGLKRGGSLNIAKSRITLACKASAIPKHIDVDIAKLQMGQAIHANDLILPEGTKLVDESNPTIINITGRGGGAVES